MDVAIDDRFSSFDVMNKRDDLRIVQKSKPTPTTKQSVFETSQTKCRA